MNIVSKMKDFAASLSTRKTPDATRPVHILLVLFTVFSLLAGVLFRVYDFGAHPAGLHQDEASIAVEAYSVYSTGMDRNGLSYPVHFISWGSGQNALYAYLLWPFLSLGLSAAVVRLPMLLAGFATVLIFFFIGKSLFSVRAGILAADLLLINPWHIMLCRWALESNLLPFVVSLGVLLLIVGRRHAISYLGGMAVMALALYAYGTAYFFVPIFLFLALAWFFSERKISVRVLVAGIFVFIIVALPIGVFILVNSLGWSDVKWFGLTMPRLPADPRYEVLTGFRHGGSGMDFLRNASALFRILYFNTDDLTWSLLPAYGYLFAGGFFLIGLIVFRATAKWRQFLPGARILVLVWFVLAVPLGIIQPPVVNRINLIFPAIVLLLAWVLDSYFDDGNLSLAGALLLVLAISSLLFGKEYFGSRYRQEAGAAFYSGLSAAIAEADSRSAASICITDTVNMPYIFVLLEHPADIQSLAGTIEYEEDRASFRVPVRMGSYVFGLKYCDRRDAILILRERDERPLDSSIRYEKTVFDEYAVYRPVGEAETGNP